MSSNKADILTATRHLLDALQNAIDVADSITPGDSRAGDAFYEAIFPHCPVYFDLAELANVLQEILAKHKEGQPCA